MKFVLEQLAICPPDRTKAIKLLREIGLTSWAEDLVVAEGQVFGGTKATNVADLAFNYQTEDDAMGNSPTTKGNLEFEVLNYRTGPNWMANYEPSASHLGMHVTNQELHDWRKFFAARDIKVAQEVDTLSHTNPVIAGKRSYKYVIFNTRQILGIDLKFIVRRDIEQA